VPSVAYPLPTLRKALSQIDAELSHEDEMMTRFGGGATAAEGGGGTTDGSGSGSSGVGGSSGSVGDNRVSSIDLDLGHEDEMIARFGNGAAASEGGGGTANSGVGGSIGSVGGDRVSAIELDLGHEDEMMARFGDNAIPATAATAGAPPPAAAAALADVMVGYLASYENVGRARIECESGCECEPVEVDALWDKRSSQTAFVTLRATQRAECRVRVVTLPPPESSGPGRDVSVKFKVSALVVNTAPREWINGAMLGDILHWNELAD